jgi:DNA-binding response OmpR family regulator
MPELILAFDVEVGTTRLPPDEQEFVIVAAGSEPQCLRLLYEERPQLLMMDISCRQEAGVEMCRLIRQMCDIPILCLVPADSQTLIACLEAGADECVTKPVGALELRARIQALLRRADGHADSCGRLVRVGDILIDVDAHRVSKRGVPVPLTPREFKLLAALAEGRNRLASHEELLARVWGTEFINDTHYLRLYIGYLRQKLEDDPRHPCYILTEWGIGYRLNSDGVSSVPAAVPARAAQLRNTQRVSLAITAAG